MIAQKNIALISPSKEAYSETFIQMHRKGIYGNVVYYFGGELPIYNDIRGKLATLLLKIRYRFSNTKMLYKEYVLLKSLKKEKIDVIVAEYGTTATSVLNVCKKAKLSLIPIFHGYDIHINDVVERNKDQYKALFLYSKKVIAVSHSMKQKLVSLGCEGDKVMVTPCAPDDYFFELQPDFLLKNVISVGRFVEKKAPHITIKAFSRVIEKHPYSKLMMVGQGPMFDRCKRLINELNMEGSVFLLGVKSREEIRRLFLKSSIYVQHSVVAKNGDSEGTPVSILEAQAVGLPVVSTMHEGIKDVIVHGETGFLVDEHDEIEMAEKINTLLDNLSIAKLMGSNGRKKTLEKYTKKVHLDIINSIIYSE
ncbi:glycosyltransferase [Flavobacteriaceae bacterium S356]|uniref:Glycosyltransferase n=1 Tax=Asprobacillus argus TaxID=3076534 RepID=A0ABU3LE13_9FLAO|nr:glycosyltransferase [Flavobacteriaceae bacterium S356]